MNSAPAMEAETGVPLDRFFERWIYGSTLPRLKASSRVEGDELVLRVEQIGDCSTSRSPSPSSTRTASRSTS